MSIYDDIQNSLGVQLERTADIKAQQLEKTALEKKQLFNPGYGEFNPDEWEVIDGDTVKNKLDPNRVLRFAGPEGHAMDTFETWKVDQETGKRYNPYDRDPGRAFYHRRAFARQLGKDINDVSNQDLIDAGEAQAEHLRQNFNSLRGQAFTEDSKGAYGRGIARFDNPEAFDVVTKGVNAGYYSPYNSLKYLEDLSKGENPKAQEERSLSRALTGDAITSFGVSTGRMASGLTQGMALFIGADSKPAINNFFNKLNKGLDNLAEWGSSDAKLQREGFDKKEQALMSTIWDVRKREYLNENPDAEEWQANLSAIIDEAGDRLEYLIENPGRILDASLESLPYMLGVSAVGRAAAAKATQRLQGNFLKHMKTGTRSERALARPKNAKGQFLSDKAATAKYLQSDEFIKSIKSVQRNTGIATVGLTEGFTNATDVFNSVNNMSEEEAMQSEKYQELRSSGLSHEEANAKLAKEAFKSTLIATTLIAGIAAGVTGAAGFEARLFTRLGERARKGISSDNKLLALGQRVGRTTGSFTGPAFREAVEETTQSGGGELISQIASKAATGLGEVGPGVGAAAGEGGLVGLVSGGVMGSAGNVTRDVLDVAGAGVEKLSSKNTRLDEAPKGRTDITTGNNTTQVQERIRADKQAGKSSEDFFLETTGQAEGATEDTPLSPVAVNSSYSAVLKDPKISAERKLELGKVYDTTMTKIKVEATAQAKEVLDTNTAEEIKNNKESLAKLRMATKLGGLNKKDVDPSLHAFFSATTDTNTAITEAEKVIQETSKAEAAATGKPEAEVYEEKMGHSVGEFGPGLKAHADHIGEAIDNGDERSYSETQGALGNFISSQVKKLNAYREMVERIHHNGENAAEVVAELNKQNKPVVPYKWIAPNAKAEASGLLTGTSELADRIELELEAMNKVRAALANEAKIFNQDSGSIQKTSDAVIEEADVSVTREVTPTQASVSENATNVAESRTVEDELNPPPPTDDDINPRNNQYEGDPRTEEDLEALSSTAADRSSSQDDDIDAAPAESRAGSQGSGATAATEATDEGGDTKTVVRKKKRGGEVLGQETELTEGAETSSEPAQEQFTPTSTPEVRDVPETTQEPTNTGETSVNKNEDGKIIPDPEDLEALRLSVYELQQLVNIGEGDGFTDSSQIRLTSDKLTARLKSLITESKMSLSDAAKEVLDVLTRTFDNSIFEPPTNLTDNDTIDTLFTVLDEIHKGEGADSTTMASLDYAADFLSDGMVKFLGLLVGKGKLPTQEWTEKELNETRDKIEARFKKIGLPTKITKAFRTKSQKTKNLLAAVPNVVSTMFDGRTRNRLARKMNATIREQHALNGVFKFMNDFIQEFDKIHLGLLNEASNNDVWGNTPFGRENIDEDKKAIFNPLREYVIQFFYDQDTGKLDENFAGIMALEVGNWLATSGGSTLNNLEDVINDLIGREHGTEITTNDISAFGNGTLMANAASSIGQRVVSQANLQFTGSNIDPMMLDALHTSIGLMALSTVAKMDLVQIKSVTNAVRRELGNTYLEDASKETLAEEVNLLHITPKGQENEDKFSESEENENLRQSFTGAKRILEAVFSTTDYSTGPLLVPKEDTPNKISRGNTLIPSFIKNMFKKNQQYVWRVNSSAAETLDMFDEGLFLSNFMGTKDPNLAHKTLREGISSKNAGNKRSLKQLNDWRKENGTNKFYFAYKMIRSARLYIDSSSLNPQADKLHRFMLAMDAWKVSVPTDLKTNKKLQKNLLIAIGLGLDIDSSKLTREQTVEQTREKLADPVVRQVIELLKVGPSDETGKFTKEESALIASVMHKNNEVHGLAALKAWADIEKAADNGQKTITIALPMETDGKTNGFASGLMQTPPSDLAGLNMVKQLLRATGIYFKDDPYKNYPEYAGSGSKDNYQEVASETLSISEDMRQGIIQALDRPGPKWRVDMLEKIQKNQQSVGQIINGQFLEINRQFAKDPLMVVAYGAGMASTRRAIVNIAVQKFYEQLSAAKSVDEAVAVMQRYDQVIDGFRRRTFNAEASANKWRKEINKAGLVKFRTNWTMPKGNNSADPALREASQEKQFRDAHDAVFGHSLQRALENKLGPIQVVRERLNQATYLANSIFTRNFKRAIEQQKRIYRRPLSDRERKVVLNQMIKNGLVPLIKTPLSKGHLDGLMTTNDGQVIIRENKDDPRKGRAYFSSKQNIKSNTSIVGGNVVNLPASAQASITSALTGYEPNMNVGVAALVKMIHSSDGAVNGTVMNEYQILNVHDAQIGNFNEIDKIAKFANKTFYETHRDWNLAEETFNSLLRLLPLIEDTDQRLSANDKIAIDEEFLDYLIKFAGVDEKTSKSEAKNQREAWFKLFREQVNETNKARELLFGDIISVNQFAKEGTEYRVSSDDKRAPNPSRSEIIEEAETVEEVLNIIREDSERTWIVKKADMIRELSMAKARKSDLNALIKDWLSPNGTDLPPSAEDLLDVIYAVFGEDFNNKAQAEYLQDLLAIIRPALRLDDAKTKKQKPIFVYLGAANRFGRETPYSYHKESGILYINENADNVVEAILSGVIEAATVKNLEKIQTEDLKKFRDIYQKAKKWYESEGQAAKPGFPVWKVAQEMWAARKDKVQYISRYLSGIGAMQQLNEDGTRAFDFRARMKDTISTLAKALEDNSGNNVFYSSSDSMNDSIFDEADAHGLNAESVLEVFQQIRALETTPVSPATQKIFDRILETFVVPGIATIDDIVLKMATNADGSRNLGKWLNDPQQSAIFLEATSQAYYNSPHEMSLQEVALHEILHAIVGAAVGYTYIDVHGNEQTVSGDDSIRAEVDKLYKLTEDYLEKEYGIGTAWKAFLPTENTTHTELDIELAKKQFSHIFRSGNAQLHEFIAFGMTNPRFMEILGEVNTAPEGAIFEKGLITSFFNILDRIKAWLQETVLRQDRGTADKSLQLLVQKIVHVNANTRHLAQQAADEGWLTKRLDSLNDMALKKLAQLVTGRLQEWADNQSLAGKDLDEALKDKGMVKKLLKAAQSATASTMREDAMKGFRETFESALTGLDKGHWLYQMLTEVLPWADRNRSWIDILRKSERLIDMVRQQKFEHTRSALLGYFDPTLRLTRQTRENISRVLLSTDIVALWSGPNALTSAQLLNLISSPAQIANTIDALWSELEGKVSPGLYRLFTHHAQGMANMMVDGYANADQARNTHVLVNQWMVADNKKEQIDNIDDVQDILERVISLRALQKMPQPAVNEVVELMRAEMARSVKTNGFNGLMGTAQTFKDLSLEKLFDNDQSAMVKGYTSDINDAEVELRSVPVGMDAEMKAQGYTFIKDLERSHMDDGPNMALWKKKKGMIHYAKSIMSLTGKRKQGTGMYDSMFTTAPEGQDPTLTAAQVHNKLREMRRQTYKSSEAIMNGDPIPGGPHLVPLYNKDAEMVDFRYMMSYDEKKEHLKKREMFDEVLPSMMASIEDKTNSQIINHEAVDLLYEEYIAARKNPTGDLRFVMIGPNVNSEEGQELWKLLPKETKLYATEKFGGDVLYIRDDVVNMVLGFRKIAWSNNKFLGPGAPILDPIEKIWLEVMQWVRFKIAVLTPQVVIGNIVSNAVLLMSRGIPPNYILREARRAIRAMRKYQKDLRKRNELELTVSVLERDGKFAARERQELIRLNQALATNVVADLVEEGMFTSIVEEFGMNEDSTRRQLTSKLLDKFGGVTGSNMVAKVASEAFMIPGSETAQAAMMATQYGDFVGRFVQYKWQTEVKGVEKREAIHDALSTFIFYNIPQNRILQFLNDNGMMMFTKFFFRIQHIVARIFKQNPVQASLTLGLQNMSADILGSRTAEENIVNYAFLQNLTRKFHVTPWEHLMNGDMLIPTILKWIPDVFFGE